MPLYFAYGVNMSKPEMAQRCPGAEPLCVARLVRHRFMIMESGYASLKRDPVGVVWGLLWRIGFAHVRTLDAFEEVGRGLYVKAVQPVLPEGGAARRALIYLGASATVGRARPGYMERVLAAADAAGLPDAYRRDLARWLPNPAARAVTPQTPRSDAAPPSIVAPEVRPRFASPLDSRRD